MSGMVVLRTDGAWCSEVMVVVVVLQGKVFMVVVWRSGGCGRAKGSCTGSGWLWWWWCWWKGV